MTLRVKELRPWPPVRWGINFSPWKKSWGSRYTSCNAALPYSFDLALLPGPTKAGKVRSTTASIRRAALRRSVSVSFANTGITASHSS